MPAREGVFPFVVGCPRSGTTLLRAMLDSHSELAIPGESHFIPKMARLRERYERSGRFAPDAFLDDLLADARFRAWELPPGRVREALAAEQPTSLVDALRTTYGAYAAHRRKPLYGDKTPGYVRELRLLAGLFPEARFVHVLRDGRDVVLSLRELEWGQPGDVESLARFWRTNVDLALAARERLGAERYLEIRYEQLVDDPERVLGSLCSFLKIAYEPAMLTYHERPDRLAESLPSEAHHAHARLPPTKGLRDWRTQMSGDDVVRFERVAGETLEAVGYARAT